MESSGSYNMGFANLVGNAYSKHPLKDYNNGAFQIGTPGKATILEAYSTDAPIWYVTHKGKWKLCKTRDAALDDKHVKETGGELGDLTISSETDFNKGVFALAKEQNQTKVLGGTKNNAPSNDPASQEANFNASKEGDISWDDVKAYVNKFCSYTPGRLQNITIENLNDYRTSIQGFRVLAFHKKSKTDIDYQFIGIYNMLLDKGSDEAYGFAPMQEANQKFAENKPIKEVAECWEFENNNRTFCSFRDPLNRRQLSFNVPDQLTTAEAPIVADSFEYRYHTNADEIDYLVDLKSSTENAKAIAEIQKKFGVDISKSSENGPENGRQLLLKLYSN